MKKITKALLALTLSLLMLAAPISVNQLYANENILTEVTSDTINNYTYYLVLDIQRCILKQHIYY